MSFFRPKVEAPAVPEPKPPVPIPVEDDEQMRAAREERVFKISKRSGRESTILTGRLGDAAKADARGAATPSSDLGTKTVLG